MSNEREWREMKESGGGLVPAKSAARHAVPATSVTVVYCVQPKLSSIKEEKAEEAASKSMALNLLLVFLLYCIDPMNAWGDRYRTRRHCLNCRVTVAANQRRCGPCHLMNTSFSPQMRHTLLNFKNYSILIVLNRSCFPSHTICS